MTSVADRSRNMTEAERHRWLRRQLRAELESLTQQLGQLERTLSGPQIPEQRRASARAVLLDVLEEHCEKS